MVFLYKNKIKKELLDRLTACWAASFCSFLIYFELERALRLQGGSWLRCKVREVKLCSFFASKSILSRIVPRS